ncbi:hypothetical protein [Nocardia sp. NPDC046763]|uniref:hypothetical protein n=1 Tax=Nocardia sp. NPDC046763 TaxID=3155256 RepID=UPI0033C75EC5
MPEPLDDTQLEQAAVVANSAVNRGRRLPAYRRELGFDPVARLASRPALRRWLDIGCGNAHALFEADGPNYTGQDAVASHYQL